MDLPKTRTMGGQPTSTVGVSVQSMNIGVHRRSQNQTHKCPNKGMSDIIVYRAVVTGSQSMSKSDRDGYILDFSILFVLFIPAVKYLL